MMMVSTVGKGQIMISLTELPAFLKAEHTQGLCILCLVLVPRDAC